MPFFSKILFCGLMAASPAWANSGSDVGQPETSAPAADLAANFEALLEAFDALEARTDELEASLAEAEATIAMIEDDSGQAGASGFGTSNRRIQRKAGSDGVTVNIIDRPGASQLDRRLQRQARFDGITVQVIDSQVSALGSDQSDRRLQRPEHQ